MENRTDYAELLLTTYSEYNTQLVGGTADFELTLRNPERADGDMTVIAKDGAFTLRFYSMEEDMGSDFGELVTFMDELLRDESMIFELHAAGEYLLGGSRGTDEIGTYRSRARFLDALADGDECLAEEIKEAIERGNCFVRLRGWCADRCRSIILSK